MKKFFTAIWKFLTTPWFLWTLLLLILIALVWFVGVYIPFLHAPLPRLVIILVLVVLWGLNNLRLQRKKHALGNDETEQKIIDYTPEQLAIVVQELQLAFKKVIDALPWFRKKQLPWFITLGLSGSGKTSALLQSGLQFPIELNEASSDYATWRHSNDATFLDLSGSLVIHQKDKETLAQQAWQELMRLIKRYRYRKSFNGIILSIDLEDLLNQNEEKIAIQAYNLRSRLYDLQAAQGFQCPVYVQLTKVDVLNGCKEFVDLLPVEEQQNSLGFSLPSDKANTGIQYFSIKYDALIEQLLKKVLLSTVSEEKNPQKISAATLFPCELQTLKKKLQQYVNLLFEANQGYERSYVRGIFFVSSLFSGRTQQYLLQPYINQFAIKFKAPNYLIKSKTSNFINGLYRQFILQEKNTYRFSRIQYNYMLLRKGLVLSMIGVIFFAYVYVLCNSYRQNAFKLEQLNDYAHEYLVLSKSNNANETHATTLLLLDKMSRVFQPAIDPHSMRWGLYQGDKMVTAVSNFYLPALHSKFLPDLIHAIENVLQSPNTSPGEDYNYLRAYLMLGDNSHMDKAFVRDLMNDYWHRVYFNQNELKQVLSNSLRDYLDYRTTEVKLDPQLIAAVRAKLRDIPPANQVYFQIENLAPSDNFSLENNLNPGFGSIFDTQSAVMSVPGLFTVQSYQTIFKTRLDGEVDSLDYANWILGGQPAKPLSADQKQTVKQQVTNIYMTNYIAAWKKVLLSLKVLPFKNLSQAQASLDLLSQSNSPIENFLQVLSKNTILEAGDTELPPGASPAVRKNALNTQKAIATAARGKAGVKSMVTPNAANINKAVNLLGKSSGSSAVKQRTAVGTAFYEFNSFVLPPPATGGKSDNNDADTIGYAQIQTALTGLAKYVESISTAAEPNQVAYNLAVEHMKGTGDAISNLIVLANQMPEPIRGWLTTIAESTWKVVLQMAASYINQQWATNVTPEYQALIVTYPFAKNAMTDAEYGQVAGFIATGGTLDKFVQSYLAPFINMSSSPWRLVMVDNSALPIANDSVNKLYMWTQLRKVLFGAGSQINIDMTITPLELDNSAFMAELSVANKSIFVQHGPPHSEKVSWPGEGNANYASLEVTSVDQSTSRIHKSGNWAWFKLIDSAEELRVGNTNSILIAKFVIANQVVVYSIKTQPPVNPFNVNQLRSLSLPNDL